jgi:hypothetical protein
LTPFWKPNPHSFSETEELLDNKNCHANPPMNGISLPLLSLPLVGKKVSSEAGGHDL